MLSKGLVSRSRIFLLFLITMATATSALIAAPQSTFTENFDNLNNWISYGSPSPVIIGSQFGRSGVLDNNGDGTDKSGVITVSAFSGVGGLTMQADIYLDFSDTSSCGVEAAIGIANPTIQGWGGYDPYLSFSIQGIGRSCNGIAESLKGHAYFYGSYVTASGTESFFPTEVSPTLFRADSYVNGWHTLKITTDAGGHPRFYVDDIQVYQGANALASSVLSTTNPLWVGSQSSGNAGKAYHDNLVFINGCLWPNAISQVAPANGFIACNTQVPFSWATDAAASNYQIQVDDNSNFGSPETDLQLAAPTTSVTITMGDNCQSRYWRVRGTNNCGIGAWSTTRSFMVCQTLATPSPSSPADGATELAQPVQLNWSDIPGASSYGLQIDNDANFSSPLFDSQVTPSEYSAALLAGSTTYYWRVRASNNCGNSAWTTSRSFTTEVCLMPGVATALLPIDHDSDLVQPVIVDWSDGSLATKYEIQLDDDSGFAAPLYDAEFNVSTASISGLPAGATRYWRVRSYNACGWSGWTHHCSFTLCSPAVAPTLVEPAENAIIEAMPGFFDWNTVPSADSYMVEIDVVNTFNSPSLSVRKMAGLSQFGTYDLSPDTRFYWRVCAYDDCGWGLYSTARSCSTGSILAVHDIEDGVMPENFELLQNYPNPFNAETVIEFLIPRQAWVRVEVLNILGQQLALLVDQNLSAGRKRVAWNGQSVPSGIYFYRISAPDFVATRKMVLLK